MSNGMELTSSMHLFNEDKTFEVIATGKDFEYETSNCEFTFKSCYPSNLWMLDPRPAESEMYNIYPPNYLPYQFDTLPALVVFFRNLVQKKKVKAYEQILSKSNASILDLGCGNGQLLLLLKEFGPKEWKLCGSDFNEGMKQRLAPHGIDFIIGDICLYSGGKHFDLIILNQVVEHLPDVKKVLKKLHEMLEPGGVIVLETPSSDGLDAKIFKKRYWGGYHFPRHFYIFNEQNLATIVEELGFFVEKTAYLASPSFWVQSLHHISKEKVSISFAKIFTSGNFLLLALFTTFDILTMKFGGRTSNMRLIARKRY